MLSSTAFSLHNNTFTLQVSSFGSNSRIPYWHRGSSNTHLHLSLCKTLSINGKWRHFYQQSLQQAPGQSPRGCFWTCFRLIVLRGRIVRDNNGAASSEEDEDISSSIDDEAVESKLFFYQKIWIFGINKTKGNKISHICF